MKPTSSLLHLLHQDLIKIEMKVSFSIDGEINLFEDYAR